MTPRFKIRDKVTSVLDSTFLGQVVSIVLEECGVTYRVSYFKDGDPLTTNMFEFEIEMLSENGSLGFNKKDKERKDK